MSRGGEERDDDRAAVAGEDAAGSSARARTAGRKFFQRVSPVEASAQPSSLPLIVPP
jgi:hypothetical protein